MLLALCLSSAAALSPSTDLVDLHFDPRPCVDVGSILRVDLYASATDVNTVAVAGIDVILEWDPVLLELVDSDNVAAGHPWLITGFLPDPDGINTSLADGDALFTALTSPSLPAPVPPGAGLLVTTFLFRPLVPLPAGALVSMVATRGTFASTAVYAYSTPGAVLTGDISDQGRLFTCPLGTSICSGAIPNSTGQVGLIEASGTLVVAENDFTLSVSRLPANQFGFLLTSRSSAFIPFPGGSQGILCLGEPIGRGVGGVIFNAGPGGSASVPIDLTSLPIGPSAVAAMPGETWYFQSWHRDVNPTATSNFTEAVEVTFF